MTMRKRTRWVAAPIVALLTLMSMASGVSLFTSSAGAVATGKVNTGSLLPDPGKTPGAVDPAVSQDNIAQTICVVGYTRGVQTVISETRGSILASYEIDRKHRRLFVVDHLVPLELGGSSGVENLWPQRRSRSYEKDRAETALRGEVCAGHMQLVAAQQAIQTDWTTSEQAATDVRTAAAAAETARQAEVAAAQETARQAEAQRQADLQAYYAAVAAQQAEAQRQADLQAYFRAVANAQQPVQGSGGATARCNDGTLSYSQHRSGTCSSHGGVSQWL